MTLSTAISNLEVAVMIEVFALQHAHVNGSPPVEIYRSLRSVDSSVTERAIGFALGTLVTRAFISRERDSTKSTNAMHFKTTKEGDEYILNELSNNNLNLEYLDNKNFLKPKIPASDRVVPLDHNRAEYKEATNKLDEVIALVETDLSNNFEDKEQCVSELKAGRELLNSPLVNSNYILTILGNCLGYLAKKFAEVSIGDMAGMAWAAIKSLIGIS